MKYHCMFEQSGTFKNEFKKLGFEAYDYDILNDYNETDYQVDLFNEIEVAYGGGRSLFDNLDNNDTILAFFPCTRFEQQILLWFRGEAIQQKKWSMEKKLNHCLELQKELHNNYNLITKLVLICIKRNINLIIENPYSSQHYLTRYWCIKSQVVDKDRHETGDYYKKPTQYWFINCEPKNNLIFEPVKYKKLRNVSQMFGKKNFKVERSMISSDYANRFIREFIIDQNETNQCEVKEENNQLNIFDFLDEGDD